MALSKATEEASHIARFHKRVLSWDYFHLLRESSSRKKDGKVEAGSGLQEVKNTFKDVQEYLGVFEPLLFEEVKAHIVQIREREDGESDWNMVAVASCEESNEFHTVSVVAKGEVGQELSENDLLLLSSEKFQEGKSFPSAYAFAMMEPRDGKSTLKFRTFLSGEFKKMNTDEIEPSPRLLKMLSVFKSENSFLWILKITSISTIIREYAALRSVGSLPFTDLILSASEKSRIGDPVDGGWNIPKPLMEFLENNSNESQLGAIRAGLSRKPFVLIQGPPGTGKTQTILGLLSAILHATPARVQSKGGLSTLKRRPEMPLQDKSFHWMKASPWLNGANPRDIIMPVDGDDGFFPTTGNELKPEIIASKRKYRVHVLVCAPSNSALDEIVLRILNVGIRDESDRVYNPKIVRIGLKAHHSVQAVTMDYLVEQKLTCMDRPMAGGHNVAATAMERDRIRASVLDEAAIVFSTLGFSGSGVFSRMNRMFDVVIIDEAAQAVEPATLVPLTHGCKQVYLVGDPIQLPATVISTTAQKFGYGMSLFKRFQKAGYPVQMLKTQYRMHPEIRSFPSKEFYSEALDDGPDIQQLTQRLWHKYCCFGPFCFFDIDGVETQPSGSGSYVNYDEVEFILLMYHSLVSRYPELKSSSQLAIISPYKNQVKIFRERFQEIFGAQSDQLIDINTVDGFQGREKDVAIFSCVRANKDKGIGFVSDFRRMNVGITRARSSILVVGSASALMQDKHWSNLVNSAKERKCFFKVSKPFASFFTEESLNSMIAIDEKVSDEQQATADNVITDNNQYVEADPPEEQHVDDDDQMEVDDGGGFDED